MAAIHVKLLILKTIALTEEERQDRRTQALIAGTEYQDEDFTVDTIWADSVLHKEFLETVGICYKYSSTEKGAMIFIESSAYGLIKIKETEGLYDKINSALQHLQNCQPTQSTTR